MPPAAPDPTITTSGSNCAPVFGVCLGIWKIVLIQQRQYATASISADLGILSIRTFAAIFVEGVDGQFDLVGDPFLAVFTGDDPVVFDNRQRYADRPFVGPVGGDEIMNASLKGIRSG